MTVELDCVELLTLVGVELDKVELLILVGVVLVVTAVELDETVLEWLLD